MTTNSTPQTRRRWIRIAVSVVAVVALAIASFVALRSDSESTTADIAVGLGDVRRYAGPPLSLSPTTATIPPSAELGAPEDVDPDPTPPETPAAEIDCNFSFDPACGSWYWDPTPNNQPATVDNVLIEPRQPGRRPNRHRHRHRIRPRRRRHLHRCLVLQWRRSGVLPDARTRHREPEEPM